MEGDSLSNQIGNVVRMSSYPLIRKITAEFRPTISSYIAQVSNVVSNMDVNSQIEKMVSQTFLLEYLLLKPIIGPALRTSINSAGMLPLLVLADILACIEQNLGGNPYNLGTVFNNKTTNILKNAITGLQQNIQNIVFALRDVLNNVLDFLEHIGEPNVVLQPPNIQTLQGDVIAIINELITFLEITLPAALPCVKNLSVMLIGGNSRTRSHIRYQGRTYTVRKDKNGIR